MAHRIPGARFRLGRLLVATALLTALLASHISGGHTPLPGAAASAAGVESPGAGHGPAALGGPAAERYAPAAIDPTLGPPSNLVLTPLDSTS